MKWLKRQLERRFLRYLRVADASQVFTATKEGVCYLDGVRITEQELRNLQAEVKLFRATKLAKVFSGTLRKHAQMLMFENSANFEDMRSGKMLLHALVTQENILDAIDKAIVIKPRRKM